VAVDRVDFQEAVERDSIALLARQRMFRGLHLDERPLARTLWMNPAFEVQRIWISPLL
jgi:hypothetical protein